MGTYLGRHSLVWECDQAPFGGLKVGRLLGVYQCTLMLGMDHVVQL